MTTLLAAVKTGEPDAVARLYAALYPEIKRLARARLFDAGGIPSLSTTALVNEGFLRIAEREGIEGDSRAQFFAYLGKVLRSVVLDHLRGESADKRGAGATHVTLSHAEHVAQDDGSEWRALDQALERLARVEPSLAELVELRYFAGFSLEDIGVLRGVSTRTVDRDWVRARVLLEDLLGPKGG